MTGPLLINTSTKVIVSPVLATFVTANGLALLAGPTFTGTVTVVNLTATGDIDFTDSDNFSVSPDTAGHINNVHIGENTPLTGNFTTLTFGGVTALSQTNTVTGITNKTFVAPVLGAATGTSLALGGATIGSDALAITGSTTQSGVFRGTVNGALSSGAGPGFQMNGTWITGGSSTTTKPYFLIETTGATSTGWSTSGTGLGVNSASGFTGYLFAGHLNGTMKFGIHASHFANSGALRLSESGGHPELIIDASSAGFVICRQDGTTSYLDVTCRNLWAASGTVTQGGISAGAVTTSTKLVKKVTAFTDATPKVALTITVPNAAHSASITVRLCASLGAGGTVGANESSASINYDVVVTKTSGANCNAAISAAYGSTGSTGVTSSDTCAVSATVTLASATSVTVDVTVARGGGTSNNHTCLVLAEVLNSNATGVTIA